MRTEHMPLGMHAQGPMDGGGNGDLLSVSASEDPSQPELGIASPFRHEPRSKGGDTS